METRVEVDEGEHSTVTYCGEISQDFETILKYVLQERLVRRATKESKTVYTFCNTPLPANAPIR